MQTCLCGNEVEDVLEENIRSGYYRSLEKCGQRILLILCI